MELYLSAAWRLWRELPPVVRSRDRDHVRAAAGAVLRALDDAVAAFVDSHQATRRELVRHEESLRREFIDDLVATKDGKVVVLVPGSVEGPRTRSTSPSWSNPNLVD